MDNLVKYSIDSQPLRIKKGDTVTIKPPQSHPPKIEFDLPNLNLYDESGNIIEEAKNPNSYDYTFVKILRKIMPITKCRDFLNHHLNNSLPEPYFEHIEYVILPQGKGLLSENRVSFIKSWLEEKRNTNDQVEIVPDELQQRIAWLYAIGIIEYLGNHMNNHSSSSIGKVLAKGIGGKSDSIRKSIDRLRNENLLSQYEDYINETCQKLKIQKVK